MKQLLLAVSFFGLFVLSGCATIVNGTTQKVPINSNPQGAIAQNQDGVSCTTPCSLELKRKQDHIITITKEGYEKHAVTCQHVLSGAVAGNILLGGFIGAGVDAASGSMYRITPESISVELKTLAAKTEDTGLSLEKIRQLESLKESGAITEEEYTKMKSRILGESAKK